MTANTTGPPASDRDVEVDAGELDRLLPVFERLGEDAGGYGRTVEEYASISGDHTGPKVCPEAGDALRTALQQVVANLQAFGTHASDLRDAMRETVGHYRELDETGGDTVNRAGGDR